jgi:hypothetical protein
LQWLLLLWLLLLPWCTDRFPQWLLLWWLLLLLQRLRRLCYPLPVLAGLCQLLFPGRCLRLRLLTLLLLVLLHRQQLLWRQLLLLLLPYTKRGLLLLLTVQVVFMQQALPMILLCSTAAAAAAAMVAAMPIGQPLQWATVPRLLLLLMGQVWLQVLYMVLQL